MLPDLDCSNNSINNQNKKKKKSRKNGGKYGFDDYANSPTIEHDVVGAQSGDPCLCCGIGKYYYGEDKKLLEFFGNPIVSVTRHKKKVLRCNSCGHELFSNKKIIKWSAEARSSLTIHKLYGTPLYRIARLQKLFGIPVAPTTLWQQYKEVHEDCAKFVVAELFRISPEGEILLTDDTGMRILEIIQNNKNLPEKEQRVCHTGVLRSCPNFAHSLLGG